MFYLRKKPLMNYPCPTTDIFGVIAECSLDLELAVLFPGQPWESKY